MAFIKETYYNVEIENLFYTVTTLAPTDDSTITITSSYVVLTAASSITLNATTSISDGIFEGQTVTLRGTDDTNTITITNGSNVKINGNIILAENDTISFIYNSEIWIETSRNNSSVGQEGSTGHLILDASGNIYSDGSGTGANLEAGATNNIFLGNDSGNAVTIGDDNIFIGKDAGYFQTTSSGDIAIGVGTLGIYGSFISSGENVVIGNYAMNSVNNSDSNTVIGGWAGNGITEGSSNTFIGYQAGYNNSMAAIMDYNVMIGYSAGFHENSSNKLYIASNQAGTNLADGRAKALIYGEFDNSVLQFNADVKSRNLAPIINNTYNLYSTGSTNVFSNLVITTTTSDVLDLDASYPQIGQTFLTTDSTKLENVRIYLSQGSNWNGGENGILWATIYNTSGGAVTGSPIGVSDDSILSNTLTSSALPYDFDFTDFDLSGTTTYAVVISGDTSTTFSVYIHGVNSNSYTGGTMVIYVAGDDWYVDSSYDMSFDLYLKTLTTTYDKWKNLYLSGELKVDYQVKIGNLSGGTSASNGMIRFTGTDFEGYYNEWKSLTSGLSVSNPGSNRILTSDGTSTGIDGETNLTFNGSLMELTGNFRFAKGANRTLTVDGPDDDDGFNLTIKSSNSGDGGTTPTGGHLYLNTGDGEYRSGNIYLTAGDSNTGSGGYVYIAPGDSTSSTEGKIYLGHNGSSAQGTEIWNYSATILSSSTATRAKGINPYGNSAYNLGSGTGIITTTAESSYITMSNGGYEILAQIFTVKKGFTLTDVTLKLKQESGSWNGDVVAKLYSITGGTNGEPDSLLATSTNTNPITGLEGFPEDSNFTFNSVVLSSDTYYALILETSSSTSFSVSWYGAIGVYNGGIGLRNDGSWSSVTTDFSMYLNSINSKYWKDLFISGDVDFGGQVISSINMTSTTGALKVSNLNNTQENDLGALNGMIVYNTTTNKFRGRVNGVWSDFTTSGDTAPPASSLWSYTPNSTSIYFNDTVSINKITDPTATLDVNGSIATNGDIYINYISGGGNTRILRVENNPTAGQNGTHLKLLSGYGIVDGGDLYLGAGASSSGNGGQVNIYGGYSASGTKGEIYLGWDGVATQGINTYIKNNLVVDGPTSLNSNIDIDGNITLNSGANRSILVGGTNGYDLTLEAGSGSSGTGGDLYLSAGGGNTEGNVYIGHDGSSIQIVDTYIYSTSLIFDSGSDTTISVATDTSVGGNDLTLQSGNGTTTSGDVYILGNTGPTNGGNIYIRPGNGSSTDGSIYLGETGIGTTYIKNNLRIDAQAYSPPHTLNSEANIETNCNNSNIFKLSLSNSGQLENPTNTKAGATYLWIITNTSSYNLTFGDNFYWPDGSNNTISDGSVSILTGICSVADGPIYCNMIINMTTS